MNLQNRYFRMMKYNNTRVLLQTKMQDDDFHECNGDENKIMITKIDDNKILARLLIQI